MTAISLPSAGSPHTVRGAALDIGLTATAAAGLKATTANSARCAFARARLALSSANLHSKRFIVQIDDTEHVTTTTDAFVRAIGPGITGPASAAVSAGCDGAIHAHQTVVEDTRDGTGD